MKKLIVLFTLLLSFFVAVSCQNPNREKPIKPKIIDYSVEKNLINLIKETSYSKDTIFLGFVMGMKKAEFKKQLKKLRNEGKTINFSTSNIMTNMLGRFELGAGYTFVTSISMERGKNTLTGQGKYFMQPIYDNKSNLMGLNIVPFESWNNYYGTYEYKWLEPKVLAHSLSFKNASLKKSLIDNGIIEAVDVIRQKNNLVIYTKSNTINYIDLRTLLSELLIKMTEKNIIKESNKDLKF